MPQPKIILFVIGGLILAGLVFYGGFYSGQQASITGTQLDSYTHFSQMTGYGAIKDIDADKAVITMTSQTSENKIIKVKINQDTRFYQVISGGKYIEGEYVPIEAEEIGLADLKINDQVYFVVKSDEDGGGLVLLWLNVKSKPR